MTMVDTREFMGPLDEVAARELTERIRSVTASVKARLEDLAVLIAEARDRQAWMVLGYRSWTDYVAGEFADSPIRLDRDQRQELVGYLAGEGMSTRAIAPVVGATKSQVDRDIKATVPNGAGDVPPLPPTVGRDGKTYTRPAPQPAPEPSRVDNEPDPEPAAPPKSNRRPIPDAFFTATYDLTKAVDRLQRLTQDDRWPRNVGQVATKHRTDLSHAVDVLTDILNQLPAN